MDLKALLTRLEVLDKKQNLMESEDRKPAKEKERDVTLPSGAKVKARTVQGWQSQKADKDADKESKKKDESIVFKSGIANELLREFGLEEAPAAGGTAPAADPNAVKQIQAMLKPGGQGVERLQNAIDPKTGIIYYGEEQGEGGQVSPKATPFNWIQKGQQKEFQDLVKAAGLSIVPVDQKTLFGTTKVAAVDPKGLANLGKTPEPAAPAAAAPAAQKVDPDQADRDDAEMGAAMAANAAASQAAPAAQTAQPPAGGAGGAAAVEATRKRMKELMDKLEKTGGVSGAPTTESDNYMLALINKLK